MISASPAPAHSVIKLIVGLGNPGDEYAQTRHNIVFMVVDRLHLEAGFPRYRTESQALVAKADLEGVPVGLVKPQTYMNLSGLSVAALIHRYQVPFEDLLVILDEAALPFGKVRLRPHGTHGGHNGLRSIIDHLGDSGFPRLRIGIHPPDNAIANTARFVLAPFNKTERAALEDVLAHAEQAVRVVLREGIDCAMAKHN